MLPGQFKLQTQYFNNPQHMTEAYGGFAAFKVYHEAQPDSGCHRQRLLSHTQGLALNPYGGA
nr:hypothetical protein [Pseudomonas japonica]